METERTQPDYDVIIVGGRASGSMLAAYLGQQNIRVLLLERATFPSKPAASSPIIYASTLAMLDEVGADENDYAHNTPKIYSMIARDSGVNFEIPLPEVAGRNYGYAIDRARFDDALWRNALRFPTVEGRQNYAVSDLLWNEDGTRVVGIVGKPNDGGAREQHTAHVVVGADGRFSFVARKVNASETDQHDTYPTSLLYAYWTGVQPYEGRVGTAVAYGSEDYGLGYLMMDSADGTTAVTMEGQAEKLEHGGQAEAFYLDMLKKQPEVWARLTNAQMVTKVAGMRKVGNLYRAPGGPGWALTGDAYHQKDPLDGQGIYDAVFISRTLARALTAYFRGDNTWEEALAWFDKKARQETQPQYTMTLERVRTNLYVKLPLPKHVLGRLTATPTRWLLQDPAFAEAAGLYLNRRVNPDKLNDPSFVGLALLRGGLRDLSNRLDPEG